MLNGNNWFVTDKVDGKEIRKDILEGQETNTNKILAFKVLFDLIDKTELSEPAIYQAE